MIRIWLALGALALLSACALGGVRDFFRGYGHARSSALAARLRSRVVK